MSGLLSPDDYMALLVERARENDEATGLAAHPWLRTLPEQMVRDGDVALVDMSAIDAANSRATVAEKPQRAPRVYRSAASLVEARARVVARRDRAAAVRRHGTDDLAAYGGVGIRQTPRQMRRYWARVDTALSEWTRLDAKVRELDAKITRARAREAGARMSETSPLAAPAERGAL